MELRIEIEDRSITYQAGKTFGEGLEDLIKLLGEVEIGEIVLSGESKSYTFLRQIALLVNMLIKLKQTKVELKSKSFTKVEDLIFPIYR
jgi:hypothetical protein